MDVRDCVLSSIQLYKQQQRQQQQQQQKQQQQQHNGLSNKHGVLDLPGVVLKK